MRLRRTPRTLAIGLLLGFMLPPVVSRADRILCFPFSTDHVITCSFGCYAGHVGTDYQASYDTPVYAALPGTVAAADGSKGDGAEKVCDDNGGRGNYVEIDHANGYKTKYFHLKHNGVAVKAGDTVQVGCLIGYTSNSGRTSGLSGSCQDGANNGYHLHVQVEKDGTAVDPYSPNMFTDPLQYGGNCQPPACDTPIGCNSSESGHFVDCYNRNGGKETVGCPAEFGGGKCAHWWGSVVIQDFDGGSFGRGAIIDNEGTSHTTAYCVHGVIWSKYASMGSTSALGRPLSDEFEAAPSPQGTHGRLNRFEGGSIYYCDAYQAHPVYGGIGTQYEAAGGTTSSYGFPTNDPYGWNGGTRQDFEGGYIAVNTCSPASIWWTSTPPSGWYHIDQKLTYDYNGTSLDVSESPAAGLMGEIYLSEAGQGWHDYSARAWNGCGDVTVHWSGGWDTGNPSASISISPSSPDGNNGWYKTRPSVTVTGSDATSGVNQLCYRIDGGGYLTYSSPVSIPDGVHSYQGKAADRAGNEGVSPAPAAKVDTAAPAVSATLFPAQPDGQNGWYVSAPALAVAAVDPNGSNGSGVAQKFCTIDGGSEAPYSAPVVIGGDGVHTYSARATDVAGNSGAIGEQVVKVDTTAPVFDSIYTDPESRSLSVLVATWSCSDPDSGIAEYEYWIGTAAGDDDVKAATSAGSSNWAYAMNLNLSPGQAYYFSVHARNAAGLWSGVVTSQAILAVQGQHDAAPTFNAGGVSVPQEARTSANFKIVDSIGQFVVSTSQSPSFVMEHGYWHSDIVFFLAATPGAAKMIKNGSTLQLGTAEKPVVVTSGTSTFADRFYVEQPDKSSGIAAQYGAAGGPALVEGDQVWLIGKINTVGGERMVQFASPAIVGHVDPITPLFVTVPGIGGGAFNEWTPGVLGGVGLTNIGLLVKTYGGLVSYRDPQGRFFYLDNGDDLWDGSGHYGMRVVCDGFAGGAKLAMPAYGKSVIVTGISSVVMIGNQPVRAMRPRRQSDIEVLN